MLLAACLAISSVSVQQLRGVVQLVAWHGMVWHGVVWYGMVWYGMVWYGMVRQLAKRLPCHTVPRCT